MSNPAIKVAVYVQGGVVTGVSTDGPSLVDVIVVDYDDAECSEEGEANADGATFQDGQRVSDMLSHDELFYVI